MNTSKRYQLERYRSTAVNRNFIPSSLIEYINQTISTDDEAAKHTFHKIMVSDWPSNEIQLYEAINNYFPVVIPVNCAKINSEKYVFYTSNLNFVLKIIKADFQFRTKKSIAGIEITFNDKSSADCFGYRVTLEDIVTSVLSNRFNAKFELDLSNLANDSEFIENKINFYKVNLLSQFKLVMIRMGRDAKLLNLSKNNLSELPLEIINFFSKGKLTGINLSDNNIATLNKVQRINANIQKLWLEGNPLCESFEPMAYIKNITMKFPRLTELDGVTINNYGLMVPFYRNFIDSPDMKTKMVVDKFITSYFSYYDSDERSNKIDMFYDNNARLSFSTSFSAAALQKMPRYLSYVRNFLKPQKDLNNKMYISRASIKDVLSQLPATTQDPTTFTVDAFKHGEKNIVIIVEGIYKERINEMTSMDQCMHFRRTFYLNCNQDTVNSLSTYFITNELFTVSFATEEQKNIGFKEPVRNLTTLTLINPTPEVAAILCRTFSHLTSLKKSEAEIKLKKHDWDLKRALKDFMSEMKADRIPPEMFKQSDEDYSNSSFFAEEWEID